MKIRANRAALNDAVQWVAAAVPRNPSPVVLGGLRLVADGETLAFSAFDYDVSHTARIAADVIEPGECLASGSFLRGILAGLKAKEAELVHEASTLTLTADRSTYTTQTMALADYPKLPPHPPVIGTVEAEFLADAVAAASVVADDVAPTSSIRGVHMASRDGELVVVGLKPAGLIMHRLAWAGDDFSMHAPGRSLAAALKGLKGTISIRNDASGFGLSDESRAVTMRVFDDPFADWTKAERASEDDVTQITVDRDELIDAVKRAGSLGRERGEFVRFMVEPDSIEIRGATDGSSGSEIVEAEADGTRDLYVLPDLFAAALATIPGPSVRIHLGPPNGLGPRRAIAIRPIDSDDRLAAVMPRIEK